MGQVSLARFNRLNTSMIWEANINQCSLHWLSTKLYIYLKYFVPIIFRVIEYNFYYLWGSCSENKFFSSYNISHKPQKLLRKNKAKFFFRLGKRTYINIMQIYLCRINDTSCIFVLYGDNREFNVMLKQRKINITTTIFPSGFLDENYFAY